jgi:hypothetical protein
MTNETERIFDAPWVLFSDPDNEVFQIESNSGNFVAEAMMFTEAKRLTHLPELYDKLMWAAVQYCPDAFLTLDECRLCHDKKCKYREIIKLLRKVRNGE